MRGWKSHKKLRRWKFGHWVPRAASMHVELSYSVMEGISTASPPKLQPKCNGRHYFIVLAGPVRQSCIPHLLKVRLYRMALHRSYVYIL